VERYISIADYYQRTNNKQLLFDKHVSGCPSCQNPRKQLVINKFGASYICASPAWLPKTIGSLLNYSSLMELLNSHEARAIRSEISLGRYTYCNHKLCNYLSIPKPEVKLSLEPTSPSDLILLSEAEFTEDSKVKVLPKEICFDFDYTCNFRCPSCRTNIVNDNYGKAWQENKKLVEKIKKLVIDEYVKQNIPLKIRWAGGEPFVSRAYLELWEYIANTKCKNIKNIIQTNGSYLIKREALLKKFLPNIDTIRVSFDAGSFDTYKKIRINGDWDSLIENCRFLRKLVDESGESIILQSDFVVQLDNYREIPQYIKITEDIGFDNIFASKMWNWGTWDNSEFSRLNVTDPLHSNHAELVKIINNIDNPKFFQSIIL